MAAEDVPEGTGIMMKVIDANGGVKTFHNVKDNDITTGGVLQILLEDGRNHVFSPSGWRETWVEMEES
jgi:hypothetical protein